jgi:hypothetical protein
MNKLGLMLVFYSFQIMGMEDNNPHKKRKILSAETISYAFGFKIEGCAVENCPALECQQFKKSNSATSLTENRSADPLPVVVKESISFKEFLSKNAGRFER